MDTDEMCIAIARACPKVAFVRTASNGEPTAYWLDRYENAYDSDKLVRMEFDPLEDLNAIREAVLALSWFKQLEWDAEVRKIIGLGSPLAKATALDWCKAYCIVTGLWEEAG